MTILIDGAIYKQTLLDQSPAHGNEGDHKEDQTEDREVANMLKHGRIDFSEAEGSGKIGKMSQRQDHGELLGPSGKVFKREEGPAEKKHGSDEQEHR